MCGIVYVKRKDGKPAARNVRKRFAKQRGRGSSGFGYIAIKNNEVVAYERAPTEHEIMEKLAKEDAPEILFHHRFPTSTPNMEEQAHPLFVSHKDFVHQYFVAHNGVIRNALTRKEEHEKEGIEYRTELKPMLRTTLGKLYNFGTEKFNDSESLAIDTALAFEGKQVLIKSEGPAAVVGFILDGNKVVDRFFYRNSSNPLQYHTDQVMTTLCSMGVGHEVDSIRVMRLNEDGSYIEHPINVWTPYSYKTSYEPYNSHPSVLPERTGTARIIQLEELDESIEDIGKSIGLDLENANKKDGDFLRMLPDTILWEEWKKAEANKKEIEDMLGRIDHSFMSGEGATKIAQLSLRAEKVKAYAERIELELQSREGDGTLPLGDLQGARKEGNITG